MVEEKDYDVVIDGLNVGRGSFRLKVQLKDIYWCNKVFISVIVGKISCRESWKY